MFFQPQYESSAVFYEDTEKTQSIGNLKDVVLLDTTNTHADAASLIKTKSFMQKVVENLALQVHEVKEKKFLGEITSTFDRNLRIQARRNIKLEDSLEFSNAYYENEKSKHLYLRILSLKSFEVLDENKSFLAKANIYESVKLPELSFVINKIPESYLNEIIEIEIHPPIGEINKLIKKIKVKKENPPSKLLILKLKDSNPYKCRNVLNSTMQVYQEYLKEENRNILAQQQAYLEKRKQKLQKELYLFLDKQNKYLYSNIKDNGYFTLEDEINTLSKQKEVFEDDLANTDNELNYLYDVGLQKIDEDIVLDESQLEIVANIKRLKNEKETLLLSLQKDLSKPYLINTKNMLEVEMLFNKRNNIDILLAEVNQDIYQKLFNISYKPSVNSFFASNKLFIKNNFSNKLCNVKSSRANSLDLETIKDLFLAFDDKKYQLQTEISKLENYLQKINEKNTEISNISSSLNSQTAKNILNISKKLQDKKNYTIKEIEHLNHAYDLEKKHLILQLQEDLNLKKLDFQMIDKKLFSLKKAKINLISEEINFLFDKLNNFLMLKAEKLSDKKNCLEKKLKAININLQKLVSKVDLEKKIRMKIDTIKNNIDVLEKLLESKKLSYHLKVVNSKPIDFALAAITYNDFPLFRYSFLFAIFAIFLFFIIYFYASALKGFALSKEVIKDLSFDYFGLFSFEGDGDIKEADKLLSNDLECLRKIITSIDEVSHRVVTLIGSKGLNYVHHLASLYAIAEKKVLVIETKSKTDANGGLFSFLENHHYKKIPITKMEKYDLLPAGEEKYFSFELLKTSKFLQILQEIKIKYDLILIYADAKPNSAQAKIFTEFSDKIILTFKDDKKEDIKDFVNWAQDKKQLGFVSY